LESIANGIGTLSKLSFVEDFMTVSPSLTRLHGEANSGLCGHAAGLRGGKKRCDAKNRF